MGNETVLTQIADRLGGRIGGLLGRAVCLDSGLERNVTEIRLRVGRPISIKRHTDSYFIDSQGKQTLARQAYYVRSEDLSFIMSRICQYSRYAFESDIKQGYITIPGGHRIGIAGKILPDGTITEVSGLSIRIGKAIQGASEKVLPYILRGESDIYSTLIISPPGCGKTTILRDLTRNISTGRIKPYFTGINVGVVDERSEIGACIHGCPTHDVGLRTDLYDGCPKEKGILMMIRGMAPDVIVLDELGGEGDINAVRGAMHAGIRFIATVHGYGIESSSLRLDVKRMIEESLFERYVVLSRLEGPGTIVGIYNQNLQNLYKRKEK